MWSSEAAVRQLGVYRGKRSTFTDDDYMSNDGMQTAIFGPLFWSAIHMVSFNYPVHPTDEQKTAYREWLMATGNVLPCRYCRENFEENVRHVSTPNDYDSRDTFSRFCYRLHKKVNDMLKKETTCSFEDVRDMYEGFRSRCLTSEQKTQLEKEKKELGCVVPKHDGTKGKCVIAVVPRDTVIDTFRVDENCRLRAASISIA